MKPSRPQLSASKTEVPPPAADFTNLSPVPQPKDAARPGNDVLLAFAAAALISVGFLAWRLFF